MELYEIVMKLVGPVQPVGETNADDARLKNIQALTELVDRLLGEIQTASYNADRVESSMKAIGKHAMAYLSDLFNYEGK